MLKNRIVEHRKVRLGDIAENPRNHRTHDESQKDTLHAIVDEIGWLGTPLVYESERLGGKLTFVDGNMRGAEYPNEVVEVAVTDLTDKEADYALLTYDPLSQMAELSASAITELAAAFETESEAVQNLLATQRSGAGLFTPELYQSEDIPDEGKVVPPKNKEVIAHIVFSFEKKEQRSAFLARLGLEDDPKRVLYRWSDLDLEG